MSGAVSAAQQLGALPSNPMAVIGAAGAEKQKIDADVYAGLKGTMAADKAAYDKAADGYAPVKLEKPPPPPQVDPLKGFASAAGLFATIASAFTHTPAINAMNGLASAINAAKQSDWQAYEAGYRQWKDNTETMIQNHRLQAEDMKAALDKSREDLALGTAMGKAAAAQADDKIALAQWQQGEYDHLAQLAMERERLAMSAETHKLEIEKLHDDLQDRRVRQGFAQEMAAAPDDATRARVRQKISDYEAAHVEGAAATQAYREQLLGKPLSASAASERDVEISVAAEFREAHGRDAVRGDPADDAELANLRKNARKEEKPTAFSAPAVAQIKKPDGTTEMILAQQDKTTGQWVTADEKRAPVEGVTELVKSSDIVDKNDPEVQKVAAAIAGYKMAPLSGYVMSTRFGKSVTAALTDINPSYDATKFTEKAAAVRAFSTGPEAQKVNSFNSVVSHFDMYEQLADALNNNDMQTLNSVANRIASEFGGTAPTSLEAAKAIIGQEVVKAIVPGAGGEQERQAAADKLSSAQTPQQLKEALDVYREMMGTQLNTLARQYERTTGLDDFDSLLTPRAKAVWESTKAMDAPPLPARSGVTAPPAGPVTPPRAAAPGRGMMGGGTGATQLPPEVRARLKDGVVSTFRVGGGTQDWTLRNGVPVQVH
jgi:hypothetical protein